MVRGIIATVGLVLLAALAAPRALPADVVHLRSGNSVEVSQWRDAGDAIEYYRFGGLIQVPKTEILRIEREQAAPTAPPSRGPEPTAAPVPDEAYRPVVDAALRALAAGDVDQLVTYFRYFEEPKIPPVKMRDGMTRMLVVIRDRLGKPDRLEPIASTASEFMSVYVESATPERWRASDCAFRHYAFKTMMVAGATKRPAETILDLCYGQAAKRVWLSKIDFHFTRPDPEVMATSRAMMQVIQKWAQEIGLQPK